MGEGIMKIRRPEEKSGGKAITLEEMARYGAAAMQARSDPAARASMRDFYQTAAWLYTESFQAKVGSSGQVDPGFDSAQRCTISGGEADDQGFVEEAASLFITAARLIHRASMVARVLGNSRYTSREMKGILLVGFLSLARARALPDDDAFYWQDRLGEVAAALFETVGAFDYRGNEQQQASFAVTHVARVLADLAPYRAGADLAPLTMAGFYRGGVARLHASLAHLQILAGRPESALGRMEPLLTTAIDDPSDEIYALMVGLSAARRRARTDLHAAWLERLLGQIDRARDTYRSFEGRSYALQTVFSTFEYALRTWAMNDLHDADDLLAVAEALKARVVLDELSGCVTPPRPAANDTGPQGTAVVTADPAVDGSLSSSNIARKVFQALVADLPNDVVNELTQISYFAIDGMDGTTDAPAEQQSQAEFHERNLERIRSTDDARADAHGGFRGTARAATPADIRAALADEELLIEFFIPRDPFAPNRYWWILVAGRDGSQRRGFYLDPAAGAAHQYMDQGRLIERGPLSDLAAATRVAILQGDDAGALQRLRELFDLLIAPVIAMGFEPERYRRWILVPHGPLHLVPLHALVDESGRHLIERVAVTTAPSATVWLRMIREVEPVAGRLVAVGNPALADPRPPLPEAQVEVDQIRDHLQSCSAVLVLSGSDATEARVKREMLQANLLHFATHGELDVSNPRDGHRLLLSGDADEDGALHASEVRQMDLRQVRLVVLNTCNGAFCRYGPGDEPLGLLSAFICAGVGNVLGGLWALPDHAAREFIWRFYEGLDQSDPALALQRAAVRAIADGLPVAHWAGLPLVGPARGLRLT